MRTPSEQHAKQHADMMRRHREVVAKAAKLDPNDTSERAQLLRAAADQSRDHIEADERRNR